MARGRSRFHPARAKPRPIRPAGRLVAVAVFAAVAAFAARPAPAESPALDSRFIREELPGVAQGLVDDGRYVDAIDLLERAAVIAAAPDSAVPGPTAYALYEALARLHDHAGDHDSGLEVTLAKFRLACDLTLARSRRRVFQGTSWLSWSV